MRKVVHRAVCEQKNGVRERVQERVQARVVEEDHDVSGRTVPTGLLRPDEPRAALVPRAQRAGFGV